jgi:hypothetical protein
MVLMNEELRAELLRRVAVDQEARHALDVEAMAAADGENLPWLRQVITDVGWPGKSLVGEDGAHAAWLLAQHADSDPAFQRRCLDLLTAAVERGEASVVQQAYLTDRVWLQRSMKASRVPDRCSQAGEVVRGETFFSMIEKKIDLRTRIFSVLRSAAVSMTGTAAGGMRSPRKITAM